MFNFFSSPTGRLRPLATLGLPLGLAALLPLGAAGQSFNAFKTDYPVGANPRGVAVADVNADGRPDLITANANVSTVSVLLGSSTTAGIFGAKTDYPTGTGAYGVTVADVNADGRPDIITGNASAGSVTVLLNSATTPGTFTSRADYTAGSNTRVVGVVDVNGDGYPDLLAPNAGANTVSVLLNTAATPGTFGPRTNYATAATPVVVTAADVNGDSRPDLVSVDYSSNVVSVRLASGAPGAFSATRTTYATDSEPQYVLAADVNGDGRPDLLTANAAGNNVNVLLNSAATPGTFLTKVGYGTGAGTASIAAADLNGDGVLDLATANQYGNSVSILLGSTTTRGTFGTKTDYATAANPYSIAVADVSADGQLDLITANFSANSVSVRLAAPPANLTVSSGTLALPISVASSNYTSITVTGTGVARLDGAVSVSGSLSTSGTLLTNCQALTGAGSFTLAAGGTLGICDAAGISASGATGAVQTTGPRSFSADANYVYNPTATIALTGDGLPGTVRNLENRSTGTALRMSQPVQVRQRLILTSGSFGPSSAETLTLLSDASGTAPVVDAGGAAAGSTYVMQRYIGANTAGNGVASVTG